MKLFSLNQDVLNVQSALKHLKRFFFRIDPNHIIVSGQSLAATAVGKMSYFTLSNVIGSVEDIEIAIDSPELVHKTTRVGDSGHFTFLETTSKIVR